MPTVTTNDLLTQRRLWRAIPPDVQRSRPYLRSCVTLDKNGSQIAISERRGRFWLQCDGATVPFERLDDAELVAVGVLLERDGIEL